MTEIIGFLVNSIGIGTALIWIMLGTIFYRGGNRLRIFSLIACLVAMPISPMIASLPLNATTHEPEDFEVLRSGDAVVVFGAGIFADDLGGMWPSSESIRRAAVGQQIAASMGVPLVISGGVLADGLEAEAVVIAKALSVESTIVLEKQARNTHENARYVMEITAISGWRSMILVTSVRHTRRALASLQTAGGKVSAIVGVHPNPPISLLQFMPSVRGLAGWKPVVHEYVGILWYLLQGWVTPSSLSALEYEGIQDE